MTSLKPYRYRYRPMTGRTQYLWRVEVSAIVGDGRYYECEARRWDDEDVTRHVEVGQSRSFQSARSAFLRAALWRTGGHSVTVTRSDAISWPSS